MRTDIRLRICLAVIAIATTCAAFIPIMSEGGEVLPEALKQLREQLELSVQFKKIDAKSFNITCAIENKSDEDVFLLNKLYYLDFSFDIDPNSAYAFAENDDTLIIAKILYKIPPNTSVEAPEVPCVTRLKTHASLTETLLIDHPVRINLPYMNLPSEDEPVKTRLYKFFKFQLGILPSSIKMGIHEKCISEGVKYFAPSYEGAIDEQIILSSEPIEANLEAGIFRREEYPKLWRRLTPESFEE